MTEDDLTALAKGMSRPYLSDFDTDDQLAWAYDACELAQGYLALLTERGILRDLNMKDCQLIDRLTAERDALKAQLEKVTSLR